MFLGAIGAEILVVGGIRPPPEIYVFRPPPVTLGFNIKQSKFLKPVLYFQARN